MESLPHCDDLFLRFFDPWYDDVWRKWKGFPATRPDLLNADQLVGCSGFEASPLQEEPQLKVAQMIRTMLEAAQGDWQRQLELVPPVDLNWVRVIDTHFDRTRIQQLIDASDPADFSNPYLVTCCEFGVILAQVLQEECAELEWMYAWPYWESALFHPPSGTVIPVFHWAVKKMSEYGFDDGFAEKIQACTQILRDKKLRN